LVELKSETDSRTLNTFHIHFENEFDEETKVLLFQLIIAKIFTFYQSAEPLLTKSDIDRVDLSKIINELQQKYNKLEGRCPEGASAKNGGNRIYKKWVLEKRDARCLLTFFANLNRNSTFAYKALINCKVGFKNQVLKAYTLNPLAIDIESCNFDFGYNLLNSDYTLNDIDSKWNIIENVKDIILFDCERKSVMANFSFEEINKWNFEYGTFFNKYLIITFGKESHSINSIRDKIEIIRDRFKIPNNTTYTILASEIDCLLNRNAKPSVSIEFIGFEASTFWDTFLLETSINSLYELRSIKLMNIYSICLSDDIKSYILEDLFSKSEYSELISSRTKEAILELREEDIFVLKEALSNTLDLIISFELKSKVVECFINKPTIILDEAIVRNAKLVSKLSKALSLTRSIKFKSWSELTNSGSNIFLILSYRDQSKYPNYYYPNLLEFEYQNETTADAILPNFLFGHHYSWSKYYLLKEYHKYLSHPIRENNFEWNKLNNLIQTHKPKIKLNIDWNLENEFSNSEQRETFKIKTKNQKARTFNGSDLFIVTDEKIRKPQGC
jgi:hypothetical protein